VWIDRVERASSIPADVKELEKWQRGPRFSVLLHADGEYTPRQRDHSIKSVQSQLYPSWTLNQTPVELTTSELDAVEGDYIILLRVGDALAPSALYRMAESLEENDRSLILYGDQDELDGAGRRTRAWFKPRWNAEMFLAQDYISAGIAINISIARNAAAATGEADLPAFLLAATAHADGAITHIPHILCHAARRPAAAGQEERLRAVGEHIGPLGGSCSPGPFGTVKVQWPLPADLPLVTIIVPTRDKLELLKPCIEGVLEQTVYPNFEVLIIDNDSVEKATADFLTNIQRDPRVRVTRFHGAYNFSTMNNFAVSQARGTYVCLLNNDTEVLEPAWLTEMMRYAVRSEVAAVGAKLLYDDGTIQHAGVVIGLGEAAGHAHRFMPANEQGYFGMPHVTQFVSAVTAACLVVEKEKFEAVGGLDERLGHAFNDVDLCLKLEKAGWRNVYVPHAVLVHHESKTRPKDHSRDQIDRYMRELGLLQDRWGTKTYRDPQHNPNLDRYSETFVLAF
jgi:GT2 family glycosyltransferase